VFAESSEQRTENPRVENSVITPVNMDPEGSELIGAFFMSEGFVWKGLFLSFLTSVVLKMWIFNMHLSPWLN
jgi:anaerobic C4-dicarboxylate transporter